MHRKFKVIAFLKGQDMKSRNSIVETFAQFLSQNWTREICLHFYQNITSYRDQSIPQLNRCQII